MSSRRSTTRFTVLPDLRVDRVAHRPPHLVVRVSDDDGPRGTVTYAFPDGDERQAHQITLEMWARAGTRLTFVRTAESGVLVDDREVVRRAIEDPAFGGL